MKSINPIKSNWGFIKAELKKKYPQLTETDVKYIADYENDFFRNLEIKLSMNRTQLITLLDSLLLGKYKYKRTHQNIFDE